jgi:hypothetical protein
MAEIKYLTVSLNETEYKRIFDKISIDPLTDCWNWTSAFDYQGYGLVWYHKRVERIHRLIYAYFRGPIPRGRQATKQFQLDHVVCKNKKCCNPAHLEIVTQKVNVLRGNGITAQAARKTHCKRGHLFPERDPNGIRRTCPICDSLRHKARMQGPKREYWKQKQRETAQRYYERKHKKLE